MRALRTQASVPRGGSPPLGWHRSRGEIRRSEISTILSVSKVNTKRTAQELAIETLDVSRDIPSEVQRRLEKILQDRSFASRIKRFGEKVQGTTDKIGNSIDEFAQDAAGGARRIGNNIASEAKSVADDIKRSWERTRPIEKGKESMEKGMASMKKWFKENF
jgi:hypothetical protein